MISRRERGSSCNESLPLSILDISSISLISPSRCRLDTLIFFRQERTLGGLSRLLMARLVIPIIPFIGVRISWLILERNSFFALLERSAEARARSAVFLASSSSCICCPVRRKYPRNAKSSTTRIMPQPPIETTNHLLFRRLIVSSRLL